MSRPSSREDHPSSGDSDDKPPPSPSSPMPRHKSTKIKEIVDSLERPAVERVGTEPAKPKRDLKDEYKEPWKEQRERQERLERVRRGDGDLRPDLKEPWLRPHSELGTGSSVHSGSEEESEAGQDDIDHRIKTQSSYLLTKASLEIAAKRKDVLPTGTSAFEWAFEPFLGNNPEYRNAFEPTTPTSNSHSTAPSPGNSHHSGEVSVDTDEAFPDIPFENMTLYLDGKDEIATRIKMVDVRTLLMRCSLMWRTAQMLEREEWRTALRSKAVSHEEKAVKEWYGIYSKVGRAAEKAEKMARDLGIDGMQARAWYWRGRADAGRGYWDEAAMGFRRARELDPFRMEKQKSEGVEEYGKNGLTPSERRDVEWLQKVCEKKNEEVQRRLVKSVWARDSVQDLYELDEEEEEESQEPLDAMATNVEEEDYVDIAREHPEFMDVIAALKAKYKLQNLKPFTPEEQQYILFGEKGETPDGVDTGSDEEHDRW